MTLSFKNIPKHQRSVRDWLRNQGAENVHMISGGKHNRLAFTFRGESYTHPIACTPRNPHAAIDNSIHQLRRKLNIKETKMHVKPFNLNGEDKAKKAAEQLFTKPAPFNPPRILQAKEVVPVDAPSGLQPSKYEGTIACYQAHQNKIFPEHQHPNCALRSIRLIPHRRRIHGRPHVEDRPRPERLRSASPPRSPRAPSFSPANHRRW